LRVRILFVFENRSLFESPGTRKGSLHLGHLISFPSGSEAAILSLTPQDGQASCFVNMFGHFLHNKQKTMR
jgi:hypothetical protein